MPSIPDLVKLSKLEAQCAPGSQYTKRVRYVSGSKSERRKFRKEETWKKQKRLGWGAFGDVWLQRCIDGENQGELQAIKEIKKLKDNNFYKELEAIALFSHDKVSVFMYYIYDAFGSFTNLHVVQTMLRWILWLV